MRRAAKMLPDRVPFAGLRVPTVRSAQPTALEGRAGQVAKSSAKGPPTRQPGRVSTATANPRSINFVCVFSWTVAMVMARQLPLFYSIQGSIS